MDTQADPTKKTRRPPRRPEPRLLTHRSVCRMLDVDPQTLRNWSAEGVFIRPRAVIKNTWFYDAAAVEYFIKTGAWLEGDRPRVVEDVARRIAADQASSAPSPNPST